MTFTGKTVSKRRIRCNQAGDWRIGKRGEIEVTGVNLNNDAMSIALLIHELVEAVLCKQAGISEESVTNFDRKFKGDGEPGDAVNSPYNEQHAWASDIERMFCEAAGIRWDDYERAIENALK